MEKQRSTLAIKIIILILLVLLIILIPIKTLAADTPSFTVSSSVSECYDGEVVTFTIKIYNDTGVDIMPTSYYLDGTYYSINSGFMSPWQSLTIHKDYTVYFNSAQSVSYDIHLVYHEDGDYDTHTAWERVTITKKALSVITPNPMTVITPAPETTPMGVITPQPHIDVVTPDLSSMTEVTPTPGGGLDDIRVLTPEPVPDNLPQSTPSPTEYIEVENQEEQPIVLSNEPSDTYAEDDNENYQNNNDNEVISNEKSQTRIAGVMQSENVKTITNTISELDSFTKICIIIIVILLAGYIILTIRLKRQNKKDTEK